MSYAVKYFTQRFFHLGYNDAFADEFLSRIMKLLLLVQNVPELAEFLPRNGAHEDFDEDVYKNHDKIDFYRRWDHLRTKVGEMLPITPPSRANISH